MSLVIRTRLASVETQYIPLIKSDDKAARVFFCTETGEPDSSIPSTATAALLDSGGASVGTATVTSIDATIGYVLLRLQAPSSGNLPAALRITFTGGSGSAYKHDIPVRSWS